MILLYLLYVHQQKLRKTVENRELTTKLQHEQEKHEIIVDAKSREIASYSLMVSNKNQILNQIMDFNTQIFDNKENAIATARKINEFIKNNIKIEEEWSKFKIHFENVHPHFFEKLKDYCSDLTEENLKMCAYFKIGMSTKQIAELLNVAQRSVFVSRHRLKKKLGLSDKDDLNTFIRNL